MANGTLQTEERVTTVVGGICEVTLLGWQREVHEKLAGRRGARNAAIDGTASVRQAGGRVVAVFVATKHNCMDLFPCHPRNMRRDRRTDIYANHPYVRSFHDTLPAGCARCDLQMREMFRGGWRAAAEQCYGMLERVDSFAALNRQDGSGSPLKL